MSMYSSGVVKTLYEQGIMPRIIGGASGGSIIASVIATKNYEELG